MSELKLVKGGWSSEQQMYMDMCADPYNNMGEEEMAKEIGVTRKTLWSWRKHPDFWPEVYKLVERYGASKSAEVWKALISKCVKGDTEAIKLYFTVLGKLGGGKGDGPTFMQQQNFYQLEIIEANPDEDRVKVTQKPDKNIPR